MCDLLRNTETESKNFFLYLDLLDTHMYTAGSESGTSSATVAALQPSATPGAHDCIGKCRTNSPLCVTPAYRTTHTHVLALISKVKIIILDL